MVGDKTFHFYILHSPSLESYYIGHTGDEPAERLRRHNCNHKGFTSRTKDWVIVYLESYPDKATAYAREREVKSWKSRVRVEKLIGVV